MMPSPQTDVIVASSQAPDAHASTETSGACASGNEIGGCDAVSAPLASSPVGVGVTPASPFEVAPSANVEDVDGGGGPPHAAIATMLARSPKKKNLVREMCMLFSPGEPGALDCAQGL